ncbi:FAD-dependent oxidoreductase [Ktedonosporobacter rubrisoli]|uniref:FAD-dependent oxidoreductase n=1 Tax=Ktedonosporobacter rubrisoli TaxID=2509675 RepID=A0A4P6JSP4_KTERU|nr:FAD-dependent oxidoreductase [Ktedonosporobacter rubrisoli]QBD78569.1 FAD-dependent oxidoreductase [Ktedonosporobacter rubrisoli]
MLRGHEAPASLSADSRVVIVGASLTGLRAAETLREEGFNGHLTLIGDEPYAPYDRPPLSKTALSGWLPIENTTLPQLHDINAQWLLGVPASKLDIPNRQVYLADGRKVEFDRLLIATGTRARPWPDPQEAALDGVFTIRTRDDTANLRKRLQAGPKRVLIIGAGFIGSEVASVCRDLGLAVTVVERGPTPLSGALGQAAGSVAARLQRHYGVDLRCNVTAMTLEGDDNGRLRRVQLSDGDILDIDIAVVALGSIRNTEWLEGAGLAADRRGVVCDAACRAFTADGMVTDDIFVAGDVARWPHPLYDGDLIAVEHWGNAVDQARAAAHNMVCAPSARRAHNHLPSFWSNQFGVNIKLIGLPTIADEIAVTQGLVPELHFVAVYGRKGRIVAAIAVNSPRWLPAYQRMIEARADFPPKLHASDGPVEIRPVPAGVPLENLPTHSPEAAVTGSWLGKIGAGANGKVTSLMDPRVPPGTPLL